MPSNKHSSNKHSSSRHRHSEFMSNPAFSHYPDQTLPYYRWTSPPGVMKIVSIIVIIMCVAIFACVASTLAWDYDMSMMGGMGGMLPGYGGYGSYGGSYGGTYGGSGSYGGSYGSGGYGGGSGYGGGYGYGGNMYMDPKSGKGFIIGVAGVTFIAVLVIFIMVVSRQSSARGHKFYLAAIIIGAILAFLMLIATIVYLVAVNPTAQSSGSMMYNQVLQLCAQYQQQSQAQGIFLNQYLYHYCVVEPQEAIAIVLGFLVVVGLIILVVFAAKTRGQIRRWGEERVLWEEPKVLDNGTHHNSIGEWVKNVSGEPEVLLNSPNTRIGGSRDFLDNLDPERPLYLPGDSDVSSVLISKPRDYDAESADELDDEDFSSLFPPIVDETERLSYRREFDRDHQEYRGLQADLDLINQDLASAERDLDLHPEGSPQFLDALDQFNHIKSLKKSPQYLMKKKRCKHLRSKLSHIKRKISDYDRRP